MAKNLSKKRNQRLNMAVSKSKQLEKGLGIKPEDSNRLDTNFVHDMNKGGKRFTK